MYGLIPWENDLSIALRLILSIVVGGVLGHERGKKRRAAGFRTHILVCLSACIIMVTNMELTSTFQLGDPTRMPAQVISGIGFLGAGCILVTDRNRIKGLTTAAGLWAVACLGLCIGSGCYGIAIFGCVAVYLVLTVFRMMDNLMVKKTKFLMVFIEFESIDSMSRFVCTSGERGMKIVDMDLMSSKEAGQPVAVLLSLQMKKARLSNEILAECGRQEGVKRIEEL